MNLQSAWTMGELDARLQVLEDASEKGVTVITPRLAKLVASGLPGISVGTPITEALDTVFQEQEMVLGSRRNGSSQQLAPDGTVDSKANGGQLATAPKLGPAADNGAASHSSPAPLEVGEAELLTQRIRTEINLVCLLVAEAHDRKAWTVLGYSTWDQYVRNEFGYSRSRSYEILDQARVIQAIRHAAGTELIPDISAYAARQIRPHLNKVVKEIRELIAEDSREAPAELVQHVVSRVRARARSKARSGAAVASESAAAHPAAGATIDWERLFASVDYVAALPSVTGGSFRGVKPTARQIDSLRTAINWLGMLMKHLERPAHSSQSFREALGAN